MASCLLRAMTIFPAIVQTMFTIMLFQHPQHTMSVGDIPMEEKPSASARRSVRHLAMIPRVGWTAGLATQAYYGLTPDGYCGINTWSAMYGGTGCNVDYQSTVGDDGVIYLIRMYLGQSENLYP